MNIQDKNDGTAIVPKVVLAVALAYSCLTVFANLGDVVLIPIGFLILITALTISKKYQAEDRKWILIGVGVIAGTTLPLIGHLIGR